MKSTASQSKWFIIFFKLFGLYAVCTYNAVIAVVDTGNLTGISQDVVATNSKTISEKSNCYSIPDESSTCPICFGLMDLTEKVTETLCNHRFHAKCLDAWLQEKNSCPLCRAAVTFTGLDANTLLIRAYILTRIRIEEKFVTTFNEDVRRLDMKLLWRPEKLAKYVPELYQSTGDFHRVIRASTALHDHLETHRERIWVKFSFLLHAYIQGLTSGTISASDEQLKTPQDLFDEFEEDLIMDRRQLHEKERDAIAGFIQLATSRVPTRDEIDAYNLALPLIIFAKCSATSVYPNFLKNLQLVMVRTRDELKAIDETLSSFSTWWNSTFNEQWLLRPNKFDTFLPWRTKSFSFQYYIFRLSLRELWAKYDRSLYELHVLRSSVDNHEFSATFGRSVTSRILRVMNYYGEELIRFQGYAVEELFLFVNGNAPTTAERKAWRDMKKPEEQTKQGWKMLRSAIRQLAKKS